MARSRGPRVQVLPFLPAQVGRGPQCPGVYAASPPVSRPQPGHALGSAHAAEDGFCRSGLLVWFPEAWGLDTGLHCFDLWADLRGLTALLACTRGVFYNKG